MTVPHLINCGHQNNGWCLDCVGKLKAENERLTSDCAQLLEHIQAKTGDMVQDEQWDTLWWLVYPGDTSWEYPGQVIRALESKIKQLQKQE